jgi:prefoldin subunit 5
VAKVAKKTDKALKSLQKDVVKLQKQNDKLTKALEETVRGSGRGAPEVRDLLAER